MVCPHCQSPQIRNLNRRTELGYQVFRWRLSGLRAGISAGDLGFKGEEVMPRRRVLPGGVPGRETVAWRLQGRSLRSVCAAVESTAELPRTLARIVERRAASRIAASDNIAASPRGDLAQFDDSCMHYSDASPLDRVFPG